MRLAERALFDRAHRLRFAARGDSSGMSSRLDHSQSPLWHGRCQSLSTVSVPRKRKPWSGALHLEVPSGFGDEAPSSLHPCRVVGYENFNSNIDEADEGSDAGDCRADLPRGTAVAGRHCSVETA